MKRSALIAIFLLTAIYFYALDARKDNRRLKTAISKLHLLLKKLRSNAGIGECKGNLASEGPPQGQSCENVLTNSPNQPSYKQCVAKCLFHTKRPEIPKNYLPVFDADFRKEPINCNLRKKRLSKECKNRIFVNLESMGPFWIHLPAGSRKYSWFAAEKFCRSKGLVLPAFDSKLKMTQLLLYVNLLVASNRIMIMTANSPFRVWAGGMSVNDSSYFWIDTGEQIDRDYFSGLNAATGNNQKCIFIEIIGENSENSTNYTWMKGNCDSTNSFLCEVPKLCFFEKCKTKSQMRTLMSKERFMAQCVPKSCPVCTKAITDNIGRFFNLNGTLYFVSDIIMANDAAFSYCCKIQMDLWSLNSPADGKVIAAMLPLLGSYPNRTYILVNARDEKCDENFVWCDTKKRILGAEYGWMEDEPVDISGNEVCVKFSILDGQPVGFLDTQCSDKQYFICESQEPTDIANTYKKIQRIPPVFQMKIECRENKRCVKKMYWDAFEHCCSMGMHMVTIDTREELLNIESIHYRNITFKEFINHRIMFISTFYTTKNGSFWCSNDKPIDLNSIPLCLNEPDNAFPPETVMSFFSLRYDTCIGDSNALTPWHYVCQSP